MPQHIRTRYVVTGQVQGVGFRPFVYRIAHEHSLTGTVRNDPSGVVIDVQGEPAAVETFGKDLTGLAPPLARISRVSQDHLPLAQGETGFTILASSGGAGHNVLISPDTATCADCLQELFDPNDRRYLYPFINCTNCGPRYTITRSIPYDRATTSMACFPLCPECQTEYADPLNRRFHAQPNACPVCGPQVWLTDPASAERAQGRTALEQLANALAQGGVAAVKGLGGFHLACSATDESAVQELRRRKTRPDKPLAVMVPDLETARSLAHISDAEAAWLSGFRRPIVLCRPQPGSQLAPGAAPGVTTVGLMLPYTPLHHVLLRLVGQHCAPDEPCALVMTSGNAAGEPICLGNREALARLGDIADLFLLHNRDILIRVDDSVLRVHPETNEPEFFRRARGFVPEPVELPPVDAKNIPAVLGVGPELKNTLCLTKRDQAFASQHIGDLENLMTYGFFEEISEHLQSILQTEPALVIHDLHPDYLSTRYAAEYPGVARLSLQHHFAHIHAVLAEHAHAGPALGLALDGTGLGDDGTLWGGECLYVHPASNEHRRLASLRPFRLPGGEAAIRQPWRIARACLRQLGVSESSRPWPWSAQFAKADAMVLQILEKNINCPQTSSCGRLFDAVSALLGVCLEPSYEGQAAILLEAVQNTDETGAYLCPVLEGGPLLQLDGLALFQAVLQDWEQHVAPAVAARRFHLGLVQGFVDLAARLAEETGVSFVALSGGVMQNATLSVELPRALRSRGLKPLAHRALPPNDGCISLGQAAWGRLQAVMAQG